MTQVDSSAARHLGRPLDSDPAQGQGQVEINAATSLPQGWGSFCSRPYVSPQTGQTFSGRWYAVAPWHVDTLKLTIGRAANGLQQTVVADDWTGLHKVVNEQVELHEDIMREAA